MYKEETMDFVVKKDNNFTVFYNGLVFDDWWNKEEGEELENALDLVLQEQIKQQIKQEMGEEDIDICLCCIDFFDGNEGQITVSVESWE